MTFDSYIKTILENASLPTEEELKNRARANGYNIGPVYHGGNAGFNVFSYKHINMTALGKGFYFTDNKSIAQGYVKQQGGRLLSVFLDIHNPLSTKKRTITSIQLKKILKNIDPKGTEFLSNYGDVNYDGYNKILNDAANNIFEYSEDDASIIGGMISSGANAVELYDTVLKITGKNGFIVPTDWNGTKHTIYVATSPNQIKSAEIITKDDNGNIIPIESRFDKNKSDIRY